jgi:spore coat protein JB
MGMVNQREKNPTPKNSLQTLAFAIQELALYLDTHPQDKKALEQYRQQQNQYHEAVMEYGQKCGPMTHFMPVNDDAYSWISDPWPWDINGNKEG